MDKFYVDGLFLCSLSRIHYARAKQLSVHYLLSVTSVSIHLLPLKHCNRQFCTTSHSHKFVQISKEQIFVLHTVNGCCNKVQWVGSVTKFGPETCTINVLLNKTIIIFFVMFYPQSGNSTCKFSETNPLLTQQML